MVTTEPLENLKLVLTSPRRRAPDTLTTYLSIAGQFLNSLEGRTPPNELDLRRYFAQRRDGGISDNSLRTWFQALKKLYGANHWEWPLSPDDRPEASEVVGKPPFTKEEVIKLISKREEYTHNECFYLALATIYCPRRIELARITGRSIKDNTIYIETAKHGRKITHLIPEEIMPIIKAYKPGEKNVSTLSATFHRICVKGLGKVKPGYGFHSFRTTNSTLIPIGLAKADAPLTLWGEFMGWSKKSIGAAFFGTPMAGVYGRPEIVSSDPFYVDREVFTVHPFLKLWVVNH